jgi:myosin V
MGFEIKCMLIEAQWSLVHILRSFFLITARLACKQHEFLRQQAAALRIQKTTRWYFAWKTYCQLRLSAVTLQAGVRAMAARNEFNFRKRNKASVRIQVV